MKLTHASSTVRPVSLTESISGQSMDRAVAKKLPIKKMLLALTLVIVMLVTFWLIFDQGGGRTLVIGSDRISIYPVTEGVFEDFIPIRGRVTPKKTVYLDVIDGGRVEQRLVEDGAMVKAGDLIVVLSNTSLQLGVIRNEAMVTEQLNNLRTIELQLEQNRLKHKTNLVELDYRIKRLRRQVSRLADLDHAGVVIKSQLEDAGDELEYFIKLRTVTLESQATDNHMQAAQLKALRLSGNQLEQNLVFARGNLDALNVRAPVDGKLSGLDVEVGQSVQPGGRLGQIDDPENFKLRASIDEYYLSRVDLGQSAFFEKDRREFELSISKIYPQVNNGQFEVDLVFIGDEPRAIRRGQTIQAKLTLGDSTSAALIPNGAFYQDTGGKWIFVVTEDGSAAVKRNIRLGRRNSRYIEVLDGLEVGEKVVISPYSSFKDMDRLKLTAD